MKNILVSFLAIFVKPDKVRFSKFYQFYLKNFKSKKYFTDLQKELEIYKKVAGKSLSLVFDVGANEGYKSEFFLEISKKVVAFDPDKKNIEILNHRFKNNPKFQLVGKALSDSESTAKFYVAADGSPVNTMSSKWADVVNSNGNSNSCFQKEISIETTTLDKMIEKHGSPDFIKIDVEGYELNVIKGLSSPVNIIVMEANLPEFEKETCQAIEILNEISPIATFNAINNGKMIFKEFVSKEEFIKNITACGRCCLDVFCKMA